MNRCVVFLALLGCGGYSFGAGDDAGVNVGSDSVLRYSDEVEGRYLALTIVHQGKVVRALREQKESGGAFEYEHRPTFSPDKQVVVINQVELGIAETSDGRVISHEVARCNLVEIRTGCIIRRDRGQFCMGEFSADGKWMSDVDVDLGDIKPSVSEYLTGRQVVDSSDSSLENLLACDPPGDDNIENYRKILEGNIFKLDGGQLKALALRIGD